MSARRRWISLLAAAGIGLVVVLSRIFARQRSFLEWDDYIFGLALHLFAPQSYVPQPPFFPAFIHAARFANVFLRDDVAALTWTSVAASGIAAASVFGIARELFEDARVAWSAAVLFAFFPASWFYAGTPLSDTAGVAAAAGAVWLSVRSFRKPASVLAAAAVLGLASGVRPQTAFIALIPFAASLGMNRRLAAAALSILAASVGLFWCVPVFAAAGGIAPVLDPLLRQWRYVLSVTSPMTNRSPLALVARRWLIDTWDSLPYAVAAWAAVALGIVRCARRRNRGAFFLVAAGSGLYAVCAVLFLDLAATGRYVLPLLPSAALAAAAGLAAAEDRIRLPRGALTAGFVAGSIVAVGPAIAVLHTRASPPVEAAARVKALTRGSRYAIVYPASMYVPAALLFPGVPIHELEKTPFHVLAESALPVWRFGVSAPDDDRAAAWPPYRAFSSLGMGRYLRVPYGEWRAETALFGEGWFAEERDGDEAFRWMGPRAAIRFPPASGRTAVRFVLVTVPKAFARPPELVVAWNETVLDRRAIAGERTDLTYHLPPAPSGPGILTLAADRTFRPGRGDPRELSFEIRHFRWVRGARNIGN
jgi:hypothetical protein